MVDTKRKLTFALFSVIALMFLWVEPIHAHDVRPTKVNFHREYMIYQPAENILEVLRDYKRYDMLFPDIDEVSIQTSNNIHTIVRYDVKILRRNFGALLEFTEKNWSNVTMITAVPIRLYKMDKLDGSLKLYNLGPRKTKLVVDFSVKPTVYLPGFFIDRMVARTFDEAIRRLKHFVWQRQVKN